MISKAIVGFIDILGYEKLVENHMNDITVIQEIEQLIKESSVNLKEEFRLKPLPTQDIEDYRIKILNQIGIRFISDTVLFTLPISSINVSCQNFKPLETITHCIYLYLNFITMFCSLFIAKTGLVLRGGIAIGPHYENESGHNLFIFSRAYIEAYKLERRAKNPRILIDKQFLEYLQNIHFEYTNMFFYNDSDGEKCFETYAFLRRNDKLSNTILRDIKNGVVLNLETNLNKQDLNAITKLVYFAKYHNKKISRHELNFEDLSIDVSKFEKISENRNGTAQC